MANDRPSDLFLDQRFTTGCETISIRVFRFRVLAFLNHYRQPKQSFQIVKKNLLTWIQIQLCASHNTRLKKIPKAKPFYYSL